MTDYDNDNIGFFLADLAFDAYFAPDDTVHGFVWRLSSGGDICAVATWGRVHLIRTGQRYFQATIRRFKGKISYDEYTVRLTKLCSSGWFTSPTPG